MQEKQGRAPQELKFIGPVGPEILVLLQQNAEFLFQCCTKRLVPQTRPILVKNDKQTTTTNTNVGAK